MAAPHSSGLLSVSLPSGFEWRLGAEGDREKLLYCLQLAFAEAFPRQTSWTHLAQTVERYFNPNSSPVWWIDCTDCSRGESEVREAMTPFAPELAEPETLGSTVACVWACQGIGQATGCSVAYVLALWVSPDYRRRGLGSAAIQAVKVWGERHGCDAIELQVFGQNQAAQSFYRSHGFVVAGTWLQLPLC